MYKVTIEHLEQLKKALVDSQKHIKSRYGAGSTNSDAKVIKQNEKALKMLDDKYLNIKP